MVARGFQRRAVRSKSATAFGSPLEPPANGDGQQRRYDEQAAPANHEYLSTHIYSYVVSFRLLQYKPTRGLQALEFEATDLNYAVSPLEHDGGRRILAGGPFRGRATRCSNLPLK